MDLTIIRVIENNSTMQNVKRTKGKHPVRALVFLSHPTVILIAILVILAYWRVPTRVQIDLVVDQETFIVDTADTEAILHSINNQAMLVKEGTISYPENPEINTIGFTFPERIVVEALDEFRIEKMTRVPEHKEIRFGLEGVAKRISTGSSEALHDHRLTQFHTLKKSQRLVWIGILGWITATILGWYRLYEEMKG
jgi:hypothetical protein